jgi:hypothetical protein
VASLANSWKLGTGSLPRKAALDVVHPVGVVVEGYPSCVQRRELIARLLARVVVHTNIVDLSQGP